MRTFAVAAELGSFTQAADRLGLTPSAVSKLVTRLEDRLGVRLMHRTTRRIDLTAEGEAYLAGARYVLNEIEEIEASVGQAGLRPKGLLRINTGTAFGLHQLLPALPDFLAAYPEVTVSVDILDRRVDVAAERADIAIRTGPVGDERLVARKLTTMRRVVCAAPAYLAKHGQPATPADLSRHSCIVFTDQPQLSRWPFRGKDGATYLVDVTARATISSGDGLAQLALAGAGIARLGDVLVRDALESGALVALFEDVHVAEEVPISAVFLPGRNRIPKVRVMLDFLSERFGD